MVLRLGEDLLGQPFHVRSARQILLELAAEEFDDDLGIGYDDDEFRLRNTVLTDKQ